jgi:glutathione S-transferase
MRVIARNGDAVSGLTLVIGNKNYSSWSMRPWVLMRQLGIAFDEVKLRFHSEEWQRQIARWSPTGLVPVLWRGEQAVWDTMAIVETLGEWFPGHGVWPAEPAARAFARSICAEMHSGFRSLRSTMPMNIRASLPGKGMTAATAQDIARIESLWAEGRRRFGAGGPFLFGAFSGADAMYAPVVTRFATYGVALSAGNQGYCEAMRSAPGVRAWIREAREEKEVVAEDEIYAANPTGD